MTQYQAEYRGLAQYYLMAFNVHRLWRLHRVMELSLVHTLADKFKTSVNRIYRKYRKTVDSPSRHAEGAGGDRRSRSEEEAAGRTLRGH